MQWDPCTLKTPRALDMPHMLDPHCLPQPWGLWVGSRAWRTQQPAAWGPCPLGANPAVPTAWPRYRIVGTADSGQYNLEISDAELSDDAVYECQATEAALRSRRAKLTVLSKEQTPQPSLIPWVLSPPHPPSEPPRQARECCCCCCRCAAPSPPSRSLALPLSLMP